MKFSILIYDSYVGVLSILIAAIQKL